MKTERATGLNRWDLILSLRSRAKFISKEYLFPEYKQEIDFITEVCDLKDIPTWVIQIEEEFFNILFDRLKSKYNQVIE